MRNIMILTVALFSTIAFGYEQIVPVVAKTGGAYGSLWQSDLTLLNAGKKAVEVTLTFQPSGQAGGAQVKTATLPPGAVFAESDILGWFGAQGAGFLALSYPDEARTALGVSSRTYTTTEAGTFGQAVPAVPAEAVTAAGAELFLVLPGGSADERFNFGVTTLGDAAIAWQLLAPDGAVIAQVDKTYAGRVQEQYNGAEAFFSGGGGRLVKAVLTEGTAIVYGSRVDNGTNDGVFLLAPKLQSNQPPLFLGVDTTSDGTLDYRDADGDGVLDNAIPFSTGYLFNYLFTIAARDPEGDPLTFRLVNPPAGMMLTDERAGTVYYAPSTQDANKTLQLNVEITDGFAVTLARIPILVTP